MTITIVTTITGTGPCDGGDGCDGCDGRCLLFTPAKAQICPRNGHHAGRV